MIDTRLTGLDDLFDLLSLISPGVVDTSMQDQIRNTKKENFPIVEKFIDYYNNSILESPEYIAKKLYYIIENDEVFTRNLISLRDINI